MTADEHAPSAAPVRELDVRPILAAGGPPIGAILEAVAALPRGAALRLIAPFEPVPLYAKLAGMGFDHACRARDDGSWEILFTPRAVTAPGPVLLDLRNLEPPQPMLTVLETLAALPPGGALLARTRFRPVHLLEIIGQRGLAWETQEQPDGSWETLVVNAAGAEGAPPCPGPAGRP
jgi:uncharacterized protein (DUF2249 family)